MITFKSVLISYLLLALFGIALHAGSYSSTIVWGFVNIGSLLLSLFWMLWVVTVNAKERWPEATWFQRLKKIVTFQKN